MRSKTGGDCAVRVYTCFVQMVDVLHQGCSPGGVFMRKITQNWSRDQFRNCLGCMLVYIMQNALEYYISFVFTELKRPENNHDPGHSLYTVELTVQ